MKISINISANKLTCGNCKFKQQHSNAYPECYHCDIFGGTLLVKSGDWKSGLVFYRLDKCKKAENNA